MTKEKELDEHEVHESIIRTVLNLKKNKKCKSD
jgi:hypothetical protein